MLKQYLLFAGQFYYPKAGWKDFKDSFDELESAITKGNNLMRIDGENWYQIVDAKQGTIIVEKEEKW